MFLLKIKPTSWIREVVYKFLQDKIDKEVYDEALKKDQENWNRAIQNRLQGRALSRILIKQIKLPCTMLSMERLALIG